MTPMFMTFILAQALTLTLAHSGSETRLKLNRCCGSSEVIDVTSKACIKVSPNVEKNVDKHAFHLGSENSFFEEELFSGTLLPSCSPNDTLGVLVNKVTHPGFASNDTTIEDQQFIIESGHLFELETETLYESNFCVDRSFNSNHELLGTVSLYCHPNQDLDCMTRPCVRICCQNGEFFDFQTARCAPSGHSTQSTIVIADDNEKQFFGLPSCVPLQVYTLDGNTSYQIAENGDLSIANTTFNYSSYCLVSNSPSNETVNVALVCASHVQNELVELLNLGRQIIRGLFVVSIIFLAISFCDIFIRKRKKLFGVMTLCMITMLFLFYLFLTIPSFLEVPHLLSHNSLCKFEGFAIQFFYLSAMCWLSSMAFDIWTTFRHLRPRMMENSGVGWSHPRFKWYALWSWGIPSIVVSVTALMEFLPSDVTNGYILPQIGRTRCFLEDDGVIFYFHMVNLPILIGNLILFVLSSWNLCCGLWAESSMVKSKTQKRAKFVAKLFWVMGLTWIAEVISWVLAKYLPQTILVIKVSMIFDCINALQGLAIFLALFFDESANLFIKEKWQGFVSGSYMLKSNASASITRKTSAFSVKRSISSTQIEIASLEDNQVASLENNQVASIEDNQVAVVTPVVKFSKNSVSSEDSPISKKISKRRTKNSSDECDTKYPQDFEPSTSPQTSSDDTSKIRFVEAPTEHVQITDGLSWYSHSIKSFGKRRGTYKL